MELKRKKYRRLLIYMLFANIIGIFACGYYFLNEESSYGFSIFSAKNVKAAQTMKVMPLGETVGIHIKTEGVMVLGTDEVTTMNGEAVSPAKNAVRAGDYIQEANGKPVTDIHDFVNLIKESGGSVITLKIIRDGKEREASFTPVLCADGYKSGIWVRDDAQGIGTVSFIDENNRFAALGHGITDIDTSLLIHVSGGSLYSSAVSGIIKGENGTPGEMVGTIYYSQGTRIGSIDKNTASGIFGKLSEDSPWAYNAQKAVDVAPKEDIQRGEAQLLCSVDGKLTAYDVNITNIDYSGNRTNKDFIIEITDERLLEKTNGIIQGMSGSPVIQNGKLAGVTTHVFLNDCRRGYGIFAETMVEEMNEKR